MTETPPVPSPRFQVSLTEKRHEHGDVYTFIFSSMTPIPFKAGQYTHMKLSAVPAEAKSVREFSFASAPSDETLWFTVNTKSGSPFQEALKSLVIGGVAELFKIKGHMTVIEEPGAHLVMVGSGVGVAPFRSILRDLAFRNIPVTATLVQVDRPPYLYQEELAQLPCEQHRIGRQDIDATLSQVRGEHTSATYYIAGSPLFVEETQAKLSAIGIPEEKIQTDIFKGLPE